MPGFFIYFMVNFNDVFLCCLSLFFIFYFYFFYFFGGVKGGVAWINCAGFGLEHFVYMTDNYVPNTHVPSVEWNSFSGYSLSLRRNPSL